MGGRGHGERRCRVTPAALAVIVTGVDVVTALVGMENVALDAPWATSTLAGTVAAVLLLDSDTAKPPAGAGEVSVMVPWEAVPPVTAVGFTDTAERAAGAAGGVTLSVAVRLAPPNTPVIVTGVVVVTAAVLTVNGTLVAPAVTVTLAGAAATVVLLLDSVTMAPAEPAALVSVAVPWTLVPPTTLVGVSVMADNAGADANCCGVNRRTDDHGPALPPN